MKYITYIFPFVALIFIAFYSLNAEKNPLTTDLQKMSYALGTQLGMGVKSQTQDSEVDIASLQKGLNDVLAGNKQLLDEAEVKAQLENYLQMQNKKQQEAGIANKTEGEEFLKKNKTEDNVKVTDSGLQYIILEEGKGEKPSATSQVKVHYKGQFINGEEFDSSYKRDQPATFALNQVIKGWTEGLQLIAPGGKIKLFVPAELAYGATGRPGMPANSMLIFEVELLEVLK